MCISSLEMDHRVVWMLVSENILEIARSSDRVFKIFDLCASMMASTGALGTGCVFRALQITPPV